MVLVQYGWYPYKKRKPGHRHKLREDDEGLRGGPSASQGERPGVPCPAPVALRRSLPCQHLDPRPPASLTVRN